MKRHPTPAASGGWGPRLLAFLLLAPSSASALEPDYWETLTSPELPRYRQEIRFGRQLLDASDPDDVDPDQKATLVRSAVEHFERAVRLLPARVEGHFWLGAAHFEIGDDAAAMPELLRVRAIDPDSPFEPDVAFKLGVSYTRLMRFEEAVVEYDRALAVGLDDRQPGALNPRSVALSNKAEVLMGLGRLTESISTYRMAFDADDRNFGALWGLACALDRDEQVAPAREVAARAHGLDPTLNDIIGDHVFFVPAHERHYYLGLAFEAQGDTASALAQWSAYVTGAGPQGHWTTQAARHAANLELPARRPRRRPAVPRP